LGRSTLPAQKIKTKLDVVILVGDQKDQEFWGMIKQGQN